MSQVLSARIMIRVAVALSLVIAMISLFRPGRGEVLDETDSGTPFESSTARQPSLPNASFKAKLSTPVANSLPTPGTSAAALGADEVPGDNSQPELDADAIEPGSIEGLLSGLKGEVSEAQQVLRFKLLGRWAVDFPMRAATWSREHLKGVEQGQADAVIATRWFESDPVAAMAFAKSVEDPASRGTAILTLGYEALRQNPRQALELVQEVPPSDPRDDFLVQAVQEWSAKEFEAAKTWVEAFDEPELKDRLRSAAATGMAEEDGMAAAVYAASAMKSGPNQDRAVVSVLQRWVQSNPQDAVAWLEQFPDGDLKRVATQNLVPVWFQQDPESATEWLKALPQGPFRIWAQTAKESLAGTAMP